MIMMMIDSLPLMIGSCCESGTLFIAFSLRGGHTSLVGCFGVLAHSPLLPPRLPSSLLSYTPGHSKDGHDAIQVRQHGTTPTESIWR